MFFVLLMQVQFSAFYHSNAMTSVVQLPVPASQQSVRSAKKRKAPSTNDASASKNKNKGCTSGVAYSERSASTIQTVS